MRAVSPILRLSGLLVLAAAALGQTSVPQTTPTPAKRTSVRPARPRTPAKPAAASLDFSGTWELDVSASTHPNYHYEGAVLTVTQRGDHIWIQPIKQGKGSGVLGEEIVADGRAYEKALGPAGKGIVTAGWSDDKQSLRIEVKAGPQDDPNKSATQRSVWKLSEDRNVWVRDSVSISQGKAKSARLVFRRRTTASLTPTPATTPKSRPRKK